MQDMRKLSIFILGTTAVGKTKLSLELCKHMNGEVISCDSKQLYKHANLMTAKSTTQELKAFKHHMIDCLELEESSFNRNKFYDEVKIHANRMWSQGKTPIFIGGTNYYIEPALFNVENLGKIITDENNTEQKAQSKQHEVQQKQQSEYLINPSSMAKKSKGPSKQILEHLKTLSKEQKYSLLKQVDPLIAQKLHKNDENRVTSFLQRYYRDKKKPSQNYKPFTIELNNQDTLLFWVRNSDKLEHRIVVENRIKEMLGKDGILEILAVFVYLDIHYAGIDKAKHEEMKKQNDSEYIKNYLKTRLTASGIGQSIGYKQFFDFYYDFRTKLLSQYSQSEKFKQVYAVYQKDHVKYDQIFQMLQKSYEQIQSQLMSKELLQQAQQQLIKDTLAYCKRQITWIRNRIFQKDDLLPKKFYILDLAKRQRKNSEQNEGQNQCIDQSKRVFDKKDLMQRYEDKVRQKAIDIVDQVLKNGFDSAYDKYQSHEDEFKTQKNQVELKDWKKYTCKQCQIQVNGPNEWNQHINSKRHAKRVKYLQRKQQIDKWIESRKRKQAQAKQKLQKNKQQPKYDTQQK